MSVEKPVRSSPGSLGGQSPARRPSVCALRRERAIWRAVAELVSTAFQLIARQSRV